MARARALLSAGDEGDQAAVRVVQIDRARLPEGHHARVPDAATIEIDAAGRAYLVLEGKRLLFAASLARLLDTLGLDEEAVLTGVA